MSDPLSPGQHLGPFRIVRRLGGGAMGVVFLAVETELDREVALKIISPELAEDEGFRERFTREARSQARLNSGHVVQVYRYGEQDGRLFIASQLVPDGDLGALLGQYGPPLLPNALDLIAQVAEGVADAHDAGLIHRDIKTANILVRRRSEGLTAYVADFGIARTEDSHQTKTGVAVGTPSYMAPELHLGQQATVASDIYSLGCLMWATLTGSPPYAGATEFQVIRSHMDAPVRQLAPAGPMVDEVNRILRTAMAKEPGQRYPSATAMRQDLNRLVARMEGSPIPPVVPLDPSGAGAAGAASGPGQSGPGSSGPGYPGPGQSGPGQSGPGQSGPNAPVGYPGPGQPGSSGPGRSGPSGPLGGLGAAAAAGSASGPGSNSGAYAPTNVGTPPSGPGPTAPRPLAGGPQGPGSSGPGSSGPGSPGPGSSGPGSSGAGSKGGGSTMSSTTRLIVILAVAGVVLIAGVIVAVAKLTGGGGGDSGGGGGEAAGLSEYCDAVNAAPDDGNADFVIKDDVQKYVDWGNKLQDAGAPSEMSDDAKAGFDLKVNNLTGLTEDDFSDPSYFDSWESFLSPSQTSEFQAWEQFNTDNC